MSGRAPPGGSVAAETVCRGGGWGLLPSQASYQPGTGDSRVLVLFSVLCQKRAEIC